MYNVVEHMKDLEAEGYSREDAAVLVRAEYHKRKKASKVNHKKTIELRNDTVCKNRYAYATQSIPKEY